MITAKHANGQPFEAVSGGEICIEATVNSYDLYCTADSGQCTSDEHGQNCIAHSRDATVLCGLSVKPYSSGFITCAGLPHVDIDQHGEYCCN